MNFSFYAPKENLDTTRGYGQAGFNVVTALQRLGHKVDYDNPDAPVAISMCQPAWYKFYPNQYKIGYTPWESTELPHRWAEYFNNCDEVWATSQWVADVYRKCGVEKPIFVYEHGLDPSWTPKRRVKGEVLKFLHVGEPALRKGGQMAIDAFREAFGDREDVHLTVKAYYQHFLRRWLDGEFEDAEVKPYNNVTVIPDLYHPNELVELYHDNDVLVYPSYGEGFGLIPLQALGTGMAVISTVDWAPYAKWIQFPLNGRMDRSVWSVHPGDVLYPDYNSLVNLYRRADIETQYYLDWAFESAPLVHDEFNWDKKTEAAFSHIVKMFE